jgi:hypothetical protein
VSCYFVDNDFVVDCEEREREKMSDFREQIEGDAGLVSQPDPYTCQSACLKMAGVHGSVYQIRSRLEGLGSPGDPEVMAVLLRERFGASYSLNLSASLQDFRKALKKGAFLITHGWFTESGHVIAIDGLRDNPSWLKRKYFVLDPWGEFDFATWSYSASRVDSFEGCYSELGIYASCVGSVSCLSGAELYRKNAIDSGQRAAWLHCIMPGAFV